MSAGGATHLFPDMVAGILMATLDERTSVVYEYSVANQFQNALGSSSLVRDV